MIGISTFGRGASAFGYIVENETGRRMALDPNERIEIRKRRGKQFKFELELGRTKG